jgi:glycosyltransferase involved in cell wall biosynthesis
MRIGIYNPSAINEKGGVETYIQEIIKRLTKFHNVDLIAGSGKLPNSLKKIKNLRVFLYPNIRREQIQLEGNREEDDVLKYSIESSSLFYNSFQHFKKYNYDIVHVHFFGDLIIKKVIPETPVVCHFHGIIDKRFDNLILNTPVEKYVAVSKYSAKEDKRVAKDIEIVYDGVDTDFFYPRKVKKEKKFTVFTVGRHEKAKKIDVLIEAFKLIKDKDIQLIIGGAGSQTDNLKKLAKKVKNIKFIGKIPQDKLPYYYTLADVFVNPRALEDFGITVIESMACETPVIASNKAGPSESLTDKCGFRVDVSKPREIANAIIKAKNSDLEMMGRECIKRIEEYFTWDKIVDKLNKIYKEIKNKI